MRLDRLLRQHTQQGKSKVRLLLHTGRVSVDGIPETNGQRVINAFSEVSLDGAIIAGKQAVYLMLHKPAGYLSATCDPLHPTVMELLETSEELHLAGRLDRASTGLLLLTNDGKWSSKLTDPEHKVPKTYLVETAKDIAADTQHIFSQGIYFAYEDLTTRPAELTILSARQCRLTIHEGRYHQIKRMFHAVGNKVTSLHRESIGHIALDPNLHPGESRNLTAEEIMPFEPLNRGASAAAGENATSLDATQDT